jgi:hypothetical protein
MNLHIMPGILIRLINIFSSARDMIKKIDERGLKKLNKAGINDSTINIQKQKLDLQGYERARNCIRLMTIMPIFRISILRNTGNRQLKIGMPWPMKLLNAKILISHIPIHGGYIPIPVSMQKPRKIMISCFLKTR